MKMTNAKKSLSFFLCIVLIAVMALFTTGCNGNKETPDEDNPAASSQTTAENVKVDPVSGDTEKKDDDSANKSDGNKNDNTPNENKSSFVFTVTHADGTQKTFNISTDKSTVGEALLENGIIAGEDGPYGLYVKTVDGETLDYDTDGKYWAFYVDGAYGATGVDITNITKGSTYEFRAE